MKRTFIYVITTILISLTNSSFIGINDIKPLTYVNYSGERSSNTIKRVKTKVEINTIDTNIIFQQKSELSLYPSNNAILKMKGIYGFNTQTNNEFIKTIKYIFKRAKEENINVKLILGTIARESSFNHLAKNKNGTDKGFGQFVKVCCKFHNVDYDRLFEPLYAIDGIVKRYKYIQNRYSNKSEAFWINAYGSCGNTEKMSSEALINSRAYIKLHKHLNNYIIPSLKI